jgi:hypothetical protein
MSLSQIYGNNDDHDTDTNLSQSKSFKPKYSLRPQYPFKVLREIPSEISTTVSQEIPSEIPT